MRNSRPQPRRLLRNEARARHHWIIGLPGTGKSKALESLMIQDMAAGRGFLAVDIHGDLYDHLKWYLAELSLSLQGFEQQVVLIDPLDPTWTVCFNPLEVLKGMSLERAAMFLTDVIVKVWQVDPTSSPRMVWLLTNSFLALSDLGLTLVDLQRWLGDAAWRNEWVPHLSHEQVRRYWQYEFPKSRAEAQVWIAPVLNKIGPLIFDRDITVMLTGNARLNWREILDQQLIVLVKVPKGILGEGGSSLLAAFIVAQIQKAALARADTQDRPQFYLYLDEFQNYITSHIQDILSESRKYCLALVLSHQTVHQLTSDEIRGAVINTTGSLQCFRVGHEDALTLAREIFPGPDYAGRGTESLPRWLRQPEEEWKYRNWERLAQLLVNLPDRVFWFRRRGPYDPSRQRTLELPDPVMTPQLEEAVARLEEISGQRYGQSKHQLLRELDELAVRQDRVILRATEVAAPEPAVEVSQGNEAPRPKQEGSGAAAGVGAETDPDSILIEVLDEMAHGSLKKTWELPFQDVG